MNLRNSLRAALASLVCVSTVAFAGFSVIDDGSKRPVAEEATPTDRSTDPYADLRDELERTKARLAITESKLDDSRRRARRVTDALNEALATAAPPMTLGFGFGKTSMSASRIDECSLLVNALRADRVDVIGYTDSEGDPAANERVAARRAESTKTFLVDGGVNPAKIVAEARPGHYVASNATAAGRAANRRVEVIFDRDAQRAADENSPPTAVAAADATVR